MNRYVIVSIIEGEGGIINNELRRMVFERFHVKSSTLPPHFTIKGPFECEDISDLLDILDNFSRFNRAYPLKMEGYSHFDDRVIYMDVKLSREAKLVHDDLIDELDELPYIHFKHNEGKNKVFHVTVASKKIRDKFKDIWRYVNEFPYSYEGYFNNITIYKWVPHRWKRVERYRFDK